MDTPTEILKKEIVSHPLKAEGAVYTIIQYLSPANISELVENGDLDMELDEVKGKNGVLVVEQKIALKELNPKETFLALMKYISDEQVVEMVQNGELDLELGPEWDVEEEEEEDSLEEVLKQIENKNFGMIGVACYLDEEKKIISLDLQETRFGIDFGDPEEMEEYEKQEKQAAEWAVKFFKPILNSRFPEYKVSIPNNWSWKYGVTASTQLTAADEKVNKIKIEQTSNTELNKELKNGEIRTKRLSDFPEFFEALSTAGLTGLNSMTAIGKIKINQIAGFMNVFTRFFSKENLDSLKEED